MSIKLDIGCGTTPLDGFIGIDRKLGTEAYPLADYLDESVDEIYASHVLEHFDQSLADKVLAEWVRVLKPGGRIRISVPDLDRILEAYTNGCNFDLNGVIYGGQADDDDYHKCGFNGSGLRIKMRRAGLVGIKEFSPVQDDCSKHPVSLNLEAIKGTPASEILRRRNACVVMTTPRLTFADNMKRVSDVCSMGLPFYAFSGGYFHQGIERSLTTAIEAGHEWILTSDYDTVWTRETLDSLVNIFEANPDIDALAPLQMKRGGDYAFLKTNETNETAYNGDSMPTEWAHFGCTLIRAAAFESLSRPWFQCETNEHGKWEDGKRDADIAFWYRWTKAGNTVHITPRVPVGHAELMVSWPTEHLRAHYQHIEDFNNHGMPKEARS